MRVAKHDAARGAGQGKPALSLHGTRAKHGLLGWASGVDGTHHEEVAGTGPMYMRGEYEDGSKDGAGDGAEDAVRGQKGTRSRGLDSCSQRSDRSRSARNARQHRVAFRRPRGRSHRPPPGQCRSARATRSWGEKIIEPSARLTVKWRCISQLPWQLMGVLRTLASKVSWQEVGLGIAEKLGLTADHQSSHGGAWQKRERERELSVSAHAVQGSEGALHGECGPERPSAAIYR